MRARHKDTGEIIELAEEGIISRDGRRFCWYQVELIPEPIDECKPSLPSNLDEAAKKIAYGVCKQLPNGTEKDSIVYYAILAAIAGAEWMTEQGVSMQITDDTEWEEVDSFIHKNVDGGSIIQIRKK